jgi:hypothetical protein
LQVSVLMLLARDSSCNRLTMIPGLARHIRAKPAQARISYELTAAETIAFRHFHVRKAVFKNYRNQRHR